MAHAQEHPDQEHAEHFIPYLRDDLIAMCLDDGDLESTEAAAFRDVCSHLVGALHRRFLRDIDDVKRHYAPFDPDRETILQDRSGEELAHSDEELARIFRDIAKKANYFPIKRSAIEECFDKATLIQLRTRVDLDDFDRVECFARGDVYKTVPVRRFFRTRPHRVDVLQRVLLFLKYKDAAYFEQRGKKTRPGIKPGKTYVYFFKDVPKFDLELLFPNVKVGMRLKDKLMFGVPAIGGGVGVILKIVPEMLLLIGAVLFFFGARSMADQLGVTEDSARRAMPVLTAFLGVAMALGGLAVKQWTSFQKKRIEFLRDVAELLFFRNLATNRSVFHRIIDSAEEEEGKEMILALYHLFAQRDSPPTRSELDATIETWMRHQFGTVIDFDLDGAIDNLRQVHGRLPDGREITLVTQDSEERLHVVSPEDAQALLATLATKQYGY